MRCSDRIAGAGAMVVIALASTLCVAEDGRRGYFADVIEAARSSPMTTDEFIEALMVPHDVLAGMTTATLVDVCLDNPLSMEFATTSVPSQGLEFSVSASNCIAELEMRPDAGAAMMEKLVAMNAQSVSTKLDGGSGTALHIGLSFLELMLARPRVMTAMSMSQQSQLLDYCLSVYDRRISSEYMGFDTMNMLIGRLLLAIDRSSLAGLASPKAYEAVERFLAGEHKCSPEVARLIGQGIAEYKAKR